MTAESPGLSKDWVCRAVDEAGLQRQRVDALEAAHVHAPQLRRNPGTVEGVDAAALAEVVLRDAGVELVQREELLTREQPETVLRDASHDRTASAAERAVASGRRIQGRLDLELDFLAVARAVVGLHL